MRHHKRGGSLMLAAIVELGVAVVVVLAIWVLSIAIGG